MTRLAKAFGATGLIFFTAGMGGCQPPDDATDFRNGVPRGETVTMAVPQTGPVRAAGQAAIAAGAISELAAQGQVAEYYRLTRGVTGIVNGGAVLILGLVRSIVHHPPTQLQEGGATWGPWSDALSPHEWKMTVTRVGTHEYDYALQGRAKNSQNPFLTILSGRHKAAVGTDGRPVEGFGSGQFVLDWDERAKLPMPEKETGKARYQYARPERGGTTSIVAKFENARDDERPGQTVNLDYIYGSHPIQGGSMEFAYNVPMSMKDKVGARWVVKSRWLQTGAGRSDIKASGGDLPPTLTEVRASECWDVNFSSIYLSASWDARAGYGSEPACAYASADYSNL